LESSHVCLINATSCGTEILKSLVLPGIRAFTIIDPNLITEEDIGNNFFLLQEDSIGKSRAKIAAQLLLQMNDDVKKGDHLEESFESLIDSNANFFTNFSLVIATGINNEKSLIKLSQVLWETNVPLIVCKTIGFIGYIRLQVKEHTIIESHPDNSFEDLRLDQPFDTLKQYLDSYEKFDEMSRKELSHTPYLVVLFKFLNKWRTHFNRESNDLPKTFKEKNELKTLIRNQIKELRDSFRNSDDEELKELDLENFEEAIKAVNTVLISSDYIPPETQLILNDSKVSCNKSTNSSFWLSVKALKQFVSQNNSLPLIGTIPDMTSDSAKYIQLQKIYRSKAKEDSETVYNILQNLPKVGNLNVTENEINIFCKNSHNLRVVRTTSIDSELTGDRLRRIVSTIQIADDDTEHDELRYYILMRLIDRFYSFHNRFPGQCNDEVESDVSILKVFIGSKIS
jgi:amyloid beta precursor protein binding protein 1